MAKKNRAFDHSKYPNWIDPVQVTPYERNVKEHTEVQIANIVNSIRRFGWQQDTVITSDRVLVIGHGRRLAAMKLGCMMPYHMIDKTADELTDEDIRELRIADNKTNESPWDFQLLAEDLDGLDFDGFDFDLQSAADENERKADKYSSATRIPQYEPSMDEVSVDALVQTGKVEALIAEIDGADVSEEEKRFLRIAAYRHATIDFDRVADYYAGASETMQMLMEHSALVLIDLDDAIANGFTTLSAALDELMEADVDE